MLVNTLEATIFNGFSWKLVSMCVLMISRSSSNLGHVGSKTRSLVQLKIMLFTTLEANIFIGCLDEFLHTWIALAPAGASVPYGHFLVALILTKLGQKLYLNGIQVKFDNGLCRVKVKVTVTLEIAKKGHFCDVTALALSLLLFGQTWTEAVCQCTLD